MRLVSMLVSMATRYPIAHLLRRWKQDGSFELGLQGLGWRELELSVEWVYLCVVVSPKFVLLSKHLGCLRICQVRLTNVHCHDDVSRRTKSVHLGIVLFVL